MEKHRHADPRISDRRWVHLGSLILVGVLLALLMWIARSNRADELSQRPRAGDPRAGSIEGERARRGSPVSVEPFAQPSSVETQLFGQVRSIAGHVLQANVCWADDASGRAPTHCIATDREGKFSVEVPASTQSLSASAVGHLPEVVGIQHASEGHAVHFSLTPGGASVSGQVSDASGGPVIEALVTARSRASETRLAAVLSDASGKFQLSLPPGPFELRARADGYADAVDTAVSAPARDISLVLIAGSRIVGRVVVEDTEEPVAGIRVTAANTTGAATLDVETDEAGTFRLLEIPPGSYELSATGARWKGASTWVTVGLGQSTEEVLLVLEPATSPPLEPRARHWLVANRRLLLRGRNTSPLFVNNNR